MSFGASERPQITEFGASGDFARRRNRLPMRLKAGFDDVDAYLVE
jgi:hypothetical protein